MNFQDAKMDISALKILIDEKDILLLEVIEICN